MSRIERIRGPTVGTRGRSALEVEISLDSERHLRKARHRLFALPGTPIELHVVAAFLVAVAVSGSRRVIIVPVSASTVRFAASMCAIRRPSTGVSVLDGTPDIGRCGVNSVLATSIAAARAWRRKPASALATSCTRAVFPLPMPLGRTVRRQRLQHQ